MDYLDFDLSITASQNGEYMATVRTPAGEASRLVELPLNLASLASVKNDARSNKEYRGAHEHPYAIPDEDELGRLLYETLFADQIGTLYRLSRQAAQLEDKGVRVRLRIQAPELAVLPWEFLYDAHEEDFICLSRETPLVRYIETDRSPKPVSIKPPLRILGMVASPEDYPQLNIEKEKQRIEEGLKGLGEDKVILEWIEGQSGRDLLQALRKDTWHVFHFIGHGIFSRGAEEGELVLADEKGNSELLPATELGRLLADYDSLRLVILNACEGAMGDKGDLFSSTASVLVRRGLPAVIAMQKAITDQAAIEFAREFYKALAEGNPVDTSVSEARKAISIAIKDAYEWATPVLYMRAPDGHLFQVPQRRNGRQARPVDPTVEEMPELPGFGGKGWMVAGGVLITVIILYTLFMLG